MDNVDQDILLDIPDEDLPELARMYEKHKDWIPHVYSTITTGIEWKKKEKGKYMTFMSPNGCWRQDGTFFALARYYSFDIFVFSLDDSGKSVYDGITRSKRLDRHNNERIPLLFCVHNKFYPIARKAVTDKGMTIRIEIPCYMLSIPREDALKFDIVLPEDVTIKRLDSTHAGLVNLGWPHRYENSDKAISLLLEMNEAYGLFLKSNNELVSWALLSMMGQLALVQTAEAHKKKGYASIVVKYLSKRLAEKGHNAFGTVLEENVPSVRMFQKLGFSNLGISTYTLYE